MFKKLTAIFLLYQKEMYFYQSDILNSIFLRYKSNGLP